MKFYSFDETTYPGIPDEIGPEARQTNRFCLKAVSVWPKLLQDLLPIWMPAGSSETIEFAAQRHIPIARVWNPTVVFQDAFEYYKEVAKEKYGWHAGPEQCIGSRYTHAAEATEQAI